MITEKVVLRPAGSSPPGSSGTAERVRTGGEDLGGDQPVHRGGAPPPGPGPVIGISSSLLSQDRRAVPPESIALERGGDLLVGDTRAPARAARVHVHHRLHDAVLEVAVDVHRVGHARRRPRHHVARRHRSGPDRAGPRAARRRDARLDQSGLGGAEEHAASRWRSRTQGTSSAGRERRRRDPSPSST